MTDLFFPDVFRDGFTMNRLPWVPWVEPGRAGVEHCVLWAPSEDEPSVALLLRFPPGAHGDFHEHLGYELMLVLDGRLDHSDGRSFRRGDLVVEAPGSRHQMSSAQGCTVLAIRTKPAQARDARPGEIATRPAAVQATSRSSGGLR
jgi:anti-sigma factor ChrR (cupin superfamily)